MPHAPSAAPGMHRNSRTTWGDRLRSATLSGIPDSALKKAAIYVLLIESLQIPCGIRGEYGEADYENDELERFIPGFPGKSSADWGWVQHMHASLKSRSSSQQSGRAAIVLDTGAASRGSGNAGTNKEKTVRQWFVDHDLIESAPEYGVLLNEITFEIDLF